jgi:GntR family transcriptional regulator, galactonate operon transcriptional repressor
MKMTPKSTHESAVESIAGWITGGRMKAGQALPIEPDIAEALSVSRTVVREAVKTLAAKGMLRTGPRVGTRVRPEADWHLFDPQVIRWRAARGVDADFIRDIFAFRLAIEPAAAALAARHATAEDMQRLEAAYAAMEEAVEGRGSYVEADLAFHRSLLDASRNQFFAAMKPLVSSVLSVSFRQSVKSRASARASLPRHKAVLDAVRRADSAEAAAALDRLIESARNDIESDLARDDFLEQSLGPEPPAANSNGGRV